MVIGKDFVWADLSLSAGDTTAQLFAVFPDLLVHHDEISARARHAPFCAAPLDIQGKERLMNIRRLPEWMLAYVDTICRHGLYPDFKPMSPPSKRQILDPAWGDLSATVTCPLAVVPDRTLQYYQADFVTVWLRVAHLREDLCRFLSNRRSLTKEELDRIWNQPALDSVDADSDPATSFTAEEVEILYRNNPWWAEIERNAYGE